jgi:hypothetical protein
MSGQGLLRVLNTIPLMTLKQGCTLRILGSKRINLNVRILPEWRDDTFLQLHQCLPPLTEIEKTNDELGKPCYYSSPDVSQEAHMDVTLQKNVETSMGRKALLATVRVGLKKHNIESPSASEGNKADQNTSSSSILEDDDNNKPPPLLVLTAKIPEKLNVSCELQGLGSIVAESKVEGDVQFKTKAGDITVSKLRGHNINLIAGAQGIINVKQLLEGENVDLTAQPGGRIRAIMINGSTININILETEESGDTEKAATTLHFEKLDVDDALALVDVGSLYTSKNGEGAQINVSQPGGTLQTPRNVRVKSNHGHVGINTFISTAATTIKDEYGQLASVVELGGVNGSCDVAIESAEEENDDISEMTTPTTIPRECTATKVHFDSCSLNSVSAITTEHGNIGVTLDRKLEADIKLISSPAIANLDFNVFAMGKDDILKREFATYDEELEVLSSSSDDNSKDGDQHQHHGIEIDTDAFTSTSDLAFKNFSFASGKVLNQSEEPDSRFDVKVGGGKINTESAAAQALSGFQKEQDANSNSSEEGTDRPLLAVAAGGGGKVKLESTNWFGAIARRYGMDVDSITPNSRAFNRREDSKFKPPQ